MDAIERCAQKSILRALSFAALAIGTVMFGCSFNLVLALNAGACMTLICAVVLTWKGWQAPYRKVQRTEVWLMLDGKPGMPLDRAQVAIARVLRQQYYLYAQYALAVACGFWLLALAFRLFV